MEAGLPLLKFLFPQIPSLSYAAVRHSFGWTETSSKWDLKMALTVHVVRNLMSGDSGQKAPPLGKIQKRTLTDPGVKGKTWIATEKISKDEEEGGIRDWVFRCVEEMGNGDLKYNRPEVEDIEVEWTGYRPAASKDEPLPKIGEEEKYKRLMADVKSEVTVLYFHGGAYYLCDPSTHRAMTSTIAKESGGRVASVRYRLAPQTAFPGQLIDGLLVYLSLLYPPEGSLHEAVPAEHIVLAGDSAGGNMSFGLLQLLLQMHRSADGAVPVIKFHGRDVHVPLPAGVSANSGWFDIARSMPSIETNAKYDYLPPAKHDDTVTSFPKDELWPANPPRGDLFCDLSLLDHPLASVMLAESWESSPPLWFCLGDEMLADEDRLVAQRAASQGVKVQYEQYEAMPHCFQLLLPDGVNAKRCLKSWGQWARKCVEEAQSMRTEGTWIPARKGEEKAVDVVALETIGLDAARKRVRDAKERRMKGFEKEGKAMPKPSL